MNDNLKFYHIFFSLLILFGFASCPEHFMSGDFDDSSNGGVLITISGDGVSGGKAAGARTLFPSTPLFTKYELHFKNSSGSNTYGPVELNINKSEVLIENLAVGEWEITAVGYITINGNFTRAADGLAVIEVKPWENGKTTFQSVNIPISAKPGTGNGTFSYKVDFPGSINTAELYIYNIGGSPWDVMDENIATPLGANAPVNILNNKSGNMTLGAGYYMMTMKFDNGYKAISWTEVIHIYANMETRFDKIFDENYISGAITLSGNVSVSINGIQADWASLYIYSDINYNEYFAHVDTEYGGSKLFPVTMKAFDAPATLYVKLNAASGDSFFTRRLGSITLHKNDHVFNISEIFQAIKVGGTSNITINGNKPGEAYIFAYKADDDTLLTPNAAQVNLAGSNGAWEILMEQFDVLTDIYFVVQAVSTGNSTYYKKINETVKLFNSNRTNIHIETDLALLTVSGTANITINGKPPKWASITMRKVTANQDDGDWLDSSEVDFKNGNAWRVSVEPLSAPINVYFEYACIDENDIWHEGKVNYQNRELFNTNLSGIVFNINFLVIDVSGTADIKVYGKPLLEANVAMYRSDNGEEIKNSWIDLNEKIEKENGVMIDNPNYRKWSMYPLKAFDVPTNVYFVVTGFDSNGNYFEKNAATASVYNTPLNIALDIDIKELTLSGTVTLTERFAPPEKYIQIDAMVMDGNNFTGMSYSGDINYTGTGSYNWSIKLPSFGTNTTVQFRIRWNSGGDNYFITTNENRTVNNDSISGINLGTHDLYPVYTFYENTGYQNNKQPRWSASINPNIYRSWQSLNGGKVQAGDIYALNFEFTTTEAITDLDAVIRDLTVCKCPPGEPHTCYDASLLSDVRRVESNLDKDETLSGTVVFTVKKNASSAESIANAFHFMATNSNDKQPVLRFTKFEIIKFSKAPSEETWAIKVNGQNDVLKIVGPGVTTKAEVNRFKDRDDVLHVMPGPGGYYHFVVEYDLSAYAGKQINISIKTDYWIDAATRIAWQVTAVPGSDVYPTVCGSTNQLSASTAWRTLETNSNNTSTIVVPPASTPGDDGKKLYLSAYQLGSSEAYFWNFEMTITE